MPRAQCTRSVAHAKSLDTTAEIAKLRGQTNRLVRVIGGVGEDIG